jgi:SAM-dependent methyltransferase
VLKKTVFYFLGFVKKVLFPVQILKFINKGVRSIASITHQLQFLAEWGVDNPEYFDHEIDMYSHWRKSRNSLPLERGVWSSFALVGGGQTLDLCCGDGFYTKMFYSLRSKKVVGVDFDKEAIFWAKMNHSTENVSYIVGDIRYDIPDGPFDNVVWDAAVEHFTEVEITALMARIKSVMSTGAVLSGYTVQEAEHGEKHLHQHEYEFHDKQDLARFFKPYFKNVQIFETVYPNRTNLYFYASDAALPFDGKSALTLKKK